MIFFRWQLHQKNFETKHLVIPTAGLSNSLRYRFCFDWDQLQHSPGINKPFGNWILALPSLASTAIQSTSTYFIAEEGRLMTNTVSIVSLHHRHWMHSLPVEDTTTDLPLLPIVQSWQGCKIQYHGLTCSSGAMATLTIMWFPPKITEVLVVW